MNFGEIIGILQGHFSKTQIKRRILIGQHNHPIKMNFWIIWNEMANYQPNGETSQSQSGSDQSLIWLVVRCSWNKASSLVGICVSLRHDSFANETFKNQCVAMCRSDTRTTTHINYELNILTHWCFLWPELKMVHYMTEHGPDSPAVSAVPGELRTTTYEHFISSGALFLAFFWIVNHFCEWSIPENTFLSGFCSDYGFFILIFI